MKRFLAALIIVGVILLAVGGWIVLGPGPLDFAGGSPVALSDYKGPNPTGVPAELRNASLVQRGEYLASAADCEACHSPKGREPYTGGLAFNLPFGTMYSPNITPDKETGIGNWTDGEIIEADRKSVV